ncbi:Glucose dehydrogenase [FAD, quinone] [Orchesella cincta]|uniref:Glucose dehydrogenase [FAD, quinone] n=1 Tax=Orchesella cincta TaxID=48709 RepID=A0A1D2MDF1_ORCCI|nr:Glucose dehydrogenase [FAD, quinone] [Orchesella cincta]
MILFLMMMKIYNSGGAGMVVATRIANASSSNRILLLEAGGEPSVLNDIPSLDGYLANQPANTWFYNSTPQANACQNCDGKKVMTTRGKMLGGSTSTNFMMYVRGNKEDFNRWSTEDLGLQRAWANEPDALKYHGKGGLRNVAKCDYHPGAEELFAAALEKGYSLGDYNGANQEVFSPIDLTTQDGWRENTYRAYYKDTGKPSNLCIKKYAHVTKVKFQTVSGKPKAVGVVYKRQGLTRIATARKEVILSAGTFESAKILDVVRCRPAEHLRSLNISVVKDLPVGANLQDHLVTLVGPFLKAPAVNPNRDVTAQAAYHYLSTGNGILAASDALGWSRPDYADLQVIHGAFALYPQLPEDMNKMFGVRVDILKKWFNPYHKNDTDARIQKFVDLYENTTALNTPLFHKPVPGCENKEFKSDDYYRCVIRMFTFTLYHHVGSCALGKVVDGNLKVLGIDGLRVIDASVIPREPNANTQAATIMIAEKGSDLIIADMMGVVDAVNTILRALPARWPIPIPISIFTATFLTLAINSWVSYDISQDATVNSEILTLDSKCQFTTFDYIIVGGAGGEPSVLNDIPGLDGFLSNQPANTWFYNSTVQANACQNCDGKKVMTTRGKMLGGSTSTNFMMYVRGNKEDFNRWSTEDLGGDPQWNYENLLPYFKKSEDYNGVYASDPASAEYHGKGGLRNVATYDFQPGADEFLAAAVEKGYTIGDYNGANQEVFSKIDLTTQNGWRESTYRAFYRDTGKPSNLCIKKYAHVQNFFSNCFRSAKSYFSNVQRQGLTRTVDVTAQAAVSYLSTGNGVLAATEALAGQAFFKSPVAEPDYADLQVIQTSF